MIDDEDIPEYSDVQDTPRPDILDVVKLEDRWTQVMGGGDVIRFLDTGEEQLINWDEYKLERKLYSTVEDMTETYDDELTVTEIENIHHSEPASKERMTKVTAEYRKK